MFITEETQVARLDIQTNDDWGGSKGHIAIIERPDGLYLTGAHDNGDNEISGYQFLLKVKPGQKLPDEDDDLSDLSPDERRKMYFEELLDGVDNLPLGTTKELFYFFPQTNDVLPELAKLLGIETVDE